MIAMLCGAFANDVGGDDPDLAGDECAADGGGYGGGEAGEPQPCGWRRGLGGGHGWCRYSMWNRFGFAGVAVFRLCICLGFRSVFSGWCLLRRQGVVVLEKAGAVVLGAVFGVRSSSISGMRGRERHERAGAMIAAL